jgi:membrane-associated phospholipid phosphatase
VTMPTATTAAEMVAQADVGGAVSGLVSPVLDAASPAASSLADAASGASGVSAADAGLGLVVLAAVGLFAFVARRVATKEAEPLDQGVRRWTQDRRTAAGDLAARPVTLLSLPGVVVPATAALVWWLWRAGRRHAALALGVAPVAAATAGLSFTTFLAQRNPPDAGDAPDGEVTEPSFPSGHTTGVTAEALSVAYVLSRERIASPAALAALLGWPLVVGATRVYRDRHWASDVLGGWAAGVAVAAMCALLYEHAGRSSVVAPSA